MEYIGNQDFRGYLAALAEKNDDYLARTLVGAGGNGMGFVNNEGQITADDDTLGQWMGGVTAQDTADSVQALKNYAAQQYANYTRQTQPVSTTSTISAAEKARLAAEEAERQTLRSQIATRGGDIDNIYSTLFGDLDALVRSRDAELEGQYGEQLGKASEQYAGAIPMIEGSYAALGAADSTDTSDAKTGAKKGFDETTETIGKNKQADKAKLGQYKTENEAKFRADQEAAKRNISRSTETTDVDALRGLRNDLETNLDTANVTRATLGTEGSARETVKNLTKDAGRYDAAVNALDSILKSSMSGAVKQAAVEAITTSAGLDDDEKKKVQEQFGNVYAEQAAL